jgi:hypothetical protein
MEIRLKYSIILVALLSSAPILAQANCNTVMGGCTTEETVNVAPHMRAENLKKSQAAAEKPALKAAKPANANVTSANKAKDGAKKI